ncbi:Lrp/AsnC family transcriptional regulator [Microbacterium capsulatum]|uniref:Lrp/AsnC family transcriptional regulator n=1 Tax=Microbacterium capsulatum TaxID=3041921 RepID=A0ABU0XFE0_9MICO|nr:Lrp/AsnC family transcriptional regulator [Microbacterium sp. ASV81]MDQ4213333.1 Lrp/AsnC family transcriptional regulator [Microbacterium sp. ASV81]
MPHETVLDPLDRRLLNALQVEPRATWTALAPVVGADPATLSRRWQRLHEDGIAWITGRFGGATLPGAAMIEVECAPRRVEETAAALAEDAEVLVLDQTAGSRDLLVTASCGSIDALGEYVTGRIAALPGVRSLRTHPWIDLLLEGGDWRLRALSDQERLALPAVPPPRPRAAATVSAPLREILRYELAVDGRATAAAIGERWSVSPQRVVDAIATLRRSGELRLRTDIARRWSDWPVYAWYFIEAPASIVEQLRTELGRVPQIRLAALTASRYNLMLAVWVRDLAAIHTFEVAFERAAPGARIQDRSLVMRIVKHMGRILDENGQATGRIVPYEPYPGQAPRAPHSA